MDVFHMDHTTMFPTKPKNDAFDAPLTGFLQVP